MHGDLRKNKKPETALKIFSETPGSGFSIAGRY
jgi:hypothetical protein